MLLIVDNTLTAIDDTLPTKEELHLFCGLLFTIGVDIIELSVAVYEKMECLPEMGKYFLHINSMEDMKRHPGFHGYTSRLIGMEERVIPEIQINDPQRAYEIKTIKRV